jgi:hypothetical protein
MNDFFAGVPASDALRIEGLARLAHELRENRTNLLRSQGVPDEETLHRDIVDGKIDEHPAYEQYLSGLTLRQARETVRKGLAILLSDPTAETATTTPLIDLAASLEEACAAELDGPVKCHQDALLLTLVNGVMLEARFGLSGEYAFHWRWGEAELRIDTAPVHPLFCPSHLHDNVGVLRADPVTDPALAAWSNLRALISALVADPLLRQDR